MLIMGGVWAFRLHTTVSSPHPADTAEPPQPSFHADMHVREVQLRSLLTQSPDDTVHLFQLGILLSQKGDFKEAASYLERYLDLHPQGRQGYLELAKAYAAIQAWDRAEQTMRAMLSIFPNDPDALYNLGAILANQGHMEEAQKYWHQVLQQPGEGESHKLARQALQRLIR